MSRLEIPKYEINTREAIRNTLVKGICNTVGNCQMELLLILMKL